MFKLSGKYGVSRDILKCDYIGYSPAEISIINNPIIQIYNKIPRGASVNGLKRSLLRLNADVLHATTNNRYIDGDDIRLVNDGSIALFCFHKLQSSSGKHIEEINHAHVVCSMYKLITSARNADELSFGFDRDRERRKRGLTNNKNKKGKIYVTIMVKFFLVLPNTRKKVQMDSVTN